MSVSDSEVETLLAPSEQFATAKVVDRSIAPWTTWRSICGIGSAGIFRVRVTQSNVNEHLHQRIAKVGIVTVCARGFTLAPVSLVDVIEI